MNVPKNSTQKQDLLQHKDYIHQDKPPKRKYIDDDSGDDTNNSEDDNDDASRITSAAPAPKPTAITRVQCVAACTPPSVV